MMHDKLHVSPLVLQDYEQAAIDLIDAGTCPDVVASDTCVPGA